MKVTVLSKDEVANYKPEKTLKQKPILIRIKDKGGWTTYPNIRYINRYKSIFETEFLDIEVLPHETERQRIYKDEIFNEQIALDLLDFIQNNLKNTSEIVIHCTAGERRSKAIGLVILSKILKDYKQYEQLSKNNAFPRGNDMVYQILGQTYIESKSRLAD
mgnify:CR=1 FL=1